MRTVSKKQAKRNRTIANIKKTLPELCACGCRRKAVDAAHLLPKSIFPEHYENALNIAGMCRICHQKYDNDKAFRQRQRTLFERAKQVDKLGAIRYFDYK